MENNDLQNAAETAAEAAAVKKPGLFSRERRKKTFIAIAVLAVLIAAAIFALDSISASSVAEKYLKALKTNDLYIMDKYGVYPCKADTDRRISSYAEKHGIEDLSAAEEEYYDHLSEIYEEDIDSWKDYCKAFHERYLEELEDLYGEFELTVEAKREKNISIRKLRSEIEGTNEGTYIAARMKWLESTGDFDLDNYSRAAAVTVSYKVYGDDVNIRRSYNVYLVRDGIFWKALGYLTNNAK